MYKKAMSTNKATSVETEMTRKTSFACCIVASIFAAVALWHSFEWLCTEYDSTCFGPAGYMQRYTEMKFDFADTQQHPSLCPAPGNASLDFWLQRHKLCTTTLPQMEYVRPQESYVCLWTAWLGMLGSFICAVWGLLFPSKLAMAPTLILFCSTMCLSVSVHTFLDWELVDDFLRVGGGGFAFFKHTDTLQLYVPGSPVAIEMTCTHYLAMLIAALGIDMFSLIALLVTR